MEKPSSAGLSQPPQRVPTPDINISSAAFEARYTELAGTLQQMRAQSTQVRMQFQNLALQRPTLTYQHQELYRRLAEKHEAIRVLPFYPSLLTPRLRRKIVSQVRAR